MKNDVTTFSSNEEKLFWISIESSIFARNLWRKNIIENLSKLDTKKFKSWFIFLHHYKKWKNLIQKEGENNDDLENDENDYFVCMTNDLQIPIIDIFCEWFKYWNKNQNLRLSK